MSTEVKVSDYQSLVSPTWCPGCGNFGIWAALKLALAELKIPPSKVVIFFDIGCNSNMADKVEGFRFKGLHGRVIPVAVGAKIANPEAIVIAIGGDGGTYSEGIGHFMHLLRNNYPITFLCHDNENYGLTTGQASATTRQCVPMNSNPDGNTGRTINPLELALTFPPALVAQGFSGDPRNLAEILKVAISNQNKGTNFVNILQTCPTYNKQSTQEWYVKNIKNIGNGKTTIRSEIIKSMAEHDPTDLAKAKQAAVIKEGSMPLGIVYYDEKSVSYLDRLEYRKEKWANSYIVDEVKKYSISELTKEFN